MREPFRSIADALEEAAESQREVAESHDPEKKVAAQVRTFDLLRKVAGLTGAAVKATDVLRLIASLVDQADVSPERTLQ